MRPTLRRSQTCVESEQSKDWKDLCARLHSWGPIVSTWRETHSAGIQEVWLKSACREQEEGFVNLQPTGLHDQTSPTIQGRFSSFSTFSYFKCFSNVQLIFDAICWFSSNFLFVWQLVSGCVPRRDETIKGNSPTVRACGQFNQGVALLGINTPIGSAFSSDMYLCCDMLCIQK